MTAPSSSRCRHLMLSMTAFLMAVFCVPAGQSADITAFWNRPTTGYWDVASNWLLLGGTSYPNNGAQTYEAWTEGEITLRGDITVSNLKSYGKILYGPHVLTALEEMEINNDLQLRNGITLVNSGNGVINASVFTSSEATTFRNSSTGTLSMTSGAEINGVGLFENEGLLIIDGATAPISSNLLFVTNSGTLRKLGAEDSIVRCLFFTNTGAGTIDNREGTLLVECRETFSGTINTESGATTEIECHIDYDDGGGGVVDYYSGGGGAVAYSVMPASTGYYPIDLVNVTFTGFGKLFFGGIFYMCGTSPLEFHAGTVGGSFSIDGIVINDGATLSPYNASIYGDYTQTGASTLVLGVGGTTSPTNPSRYLYARLLISDAATLGGKLVVNFTDGFVPASGDTFHILTFGSKTGDFESISFHDLPLGIRIDPVCGPTFLDLVACIPTPWAPPCIVRDGNPGGRPSIAWHNLSNGEVVLWNMNGGTVTGSGSIYNGGMAWGIDHLADFNGDGRDDILWRNRTTGAHAIWLMNGLNVIEGGTVYTPHADWRVLACGNYNGDGCDSLLWRNNTNGEVVIFAMNGTSVVEGKSILPKGTGWTPVPVVVDLNGDGFDDILWTRDGGSDVAAWLMGPDATVAGSGTIYCQGPAYSLAVDALGDFNGDGTTDLVWRNATNGDTSVWLMNGVNVSGFSTIFTGDATWTSANAADFDGDGKDDILWHNSTSGDYAVYRMNCSADTVAIASGAVIYQYTTDWTVVHIADFDGDGKNDLVWRNPFTGAVILWLMDGFNVKDASTLY